ncbi:MAG: type II secretion system minor pseudopilin GspK, partial [Deltaproteobacteria bacterium]|nr:type II secretion system minor pseudopilin GspK [Deltaproteobacteria bacterium]
ARVADNTHALAQAEILAQAGLKGAMALIAQDTNDYDSLNDTWAGFERFAVWGSMLFEDGRFTGKIEDLDRRLNLNALIDKKGLVIKEKSAQVERLLSSLNLDPTLAEAILDWLDKDSDTRPSGAEAPHYQTLSDPYSCANGPISALGQLTLIKGMTSEIVYGTEDRRGLAGLVTVNSGGRVNINTAESIVLTSLDEDLTQGLAEEIITLRNVQPFEKLDQLREVSGMSPKLFNRILSSISVKSSYFLVRLEAEYRQARIRVTGIIKRAPDGVSLIYYKTG